MPGCLHGHADSESCRVTGDDRPGIPGGSGRGRTCTGYHPPAPGARRCLAPARATGRGRRCGVTGQFTLPGSRGKPPGGRGLPPMCLWDARGVRPVHIRSRQILRARVVATSAGDDQEHVNDLGTARLTRQLPS